MMKMNTSTRDMLVVAKNSITPFAAIGMFGKMVNKVPEPITDWMIPSSNEASTVPSRLPTPPSTITMKQETM